MSYFKDLNGALHFLDDDGFKNLLPAGSVLITDAEADILRTPPPLTIEQKRAQLTPLNAAQIRKVLTQSGLRKQVEAAVLTASQDIQDDWGYSPSFT